MPLASLNTFKEQPAEPMNDPKARQEEPAAIHVEPNDGNDKPLAAEIQISLIDKSPHQPRLIFSPEAIDALAASIAESGLMSPITVRLLDNGRYELIGGERRMRAHQILGKETILAFVKTGISTTDAAIGALADNEAKQALCDYERGKAYRRALSLEVEPGAPKITQGTLARRIGVSDATVSRCLAFFDLPQDAIRMLDEKPDLIGAKNAAILVSLAKKGHEKIVVQALKRIKDDLVSEQGAVNWATSQVNQIMIPKKDPLPFSLNGLHIADVITEGTKVVFTCKNGFSPEDLVARLKSLTEPSKA
jgi:ParB family chromosome partitioning protein